MKQCAQKLKDGKICVVEAPVPSVGPGRVLVRSRYSLISAGTEGSTVRTARKGLIGKARERPQQVKQVLDVLRSQGPVQTYRAVMKKLDAYSPLGYSMAGQVVDKGSEVSGIGVGDWVACGGLTANHAEMVAVPKNLLVKLECDDAEASDSRLKMAAYNTLGAIAMQGVRQADLRLGEACAVIGLGLLGQLTCMLLKASGVRTVGIDIDPVAVEMAGAHSADAAMTRDQPGVQERIADFTGGLGCDAVIITAAGDSVDPINFAGAIARKRGTVVVVGDVPTGFDREPDYYRKELQVKMSCSYGPGRYDPLYEDKGVDYPAGYVRWTENRNMQAFQGLIASGKIDLGFLTTHVFDLEEAPQAFDLVVNRTEPFAGILIRYDTDGDVVRGPVPLQGTAGKGRKPSGGVRIGFLGAGSYAQSHLLPNLPKADDVVLEGVMTATSAGSRSAGDRYGFGFCTGRAEDILEHDSINTVFIASRHDSHGPYVVEALKQGKHVFVEKPLCLSLDQLEAIGRQMAGESPPLLMVGYNRRFAPRMMETKDRIGEGPMAVTYRVNAGAIPGDSWIQDRELGGGRILGEVCHFVDTIGFLTGSRPRHVYASALPDPQGFEDSLQVLISYEDGSTGHIAYLANGDKALPKERVEVFAHGSVAVLEDFKQLTWYTRGRRKSSRRAVQDKGQREEVRRFVEAARGGGDPLIPFYELWVASLVTFKIQESLRNGRSVSLGEELESRFS